MNKLLPILMFAVVFSVEKITVENKFLTLQDTPETQAFKAMLSFMHDTSYIPSTYFEYIDYKKMVLEYEIDINLNGIISSDMFFVKTEFEILDTAYCNEQSVCIPQIYSQIIADSTDWAFQLSQAEIIQDSIDTIEKEIYKSDTIQGECRYEFTEYGTKDCDTAWDEYGFDCATLETNYNWDCAGCSCPGDVTGECGDDNCNKNEDCEICEVDCGVCGECPDGYVNDCADNDCCPESWVGDGWCDNKAQTYGCDLICYENDYGDCLYIKPNIEEEYNKKGIDIDLIYEEVVNKNTSAPFYNPITSEYGIITGKIKVNVLYDKTIRLSAYRENVTQLINSTHLSLPNCDDCISFTSIDMDSLRGANEKVKSTISLHREDIYDDSWAVIIGIDKYKYSDQLNYAVKDAEAVKDMLINKFDYPEENIRYLVDDEATLSGIKIALEDIATVAEDNDRILVFYSGHGETLKGNDGAETGYIIPIEGRQDKPYSTGLAMDDILRTCQMSKSKHMLFLMDACYSGLMTENVKGVSKPQEEGYLSKVANEKARQIITAGGSNEMVIERDEWQHSAFTKNLLAGLDDWEADTDEDGYITADELGTYLRKSVTEDSDFQQTPQKGRFRNSGGGEFVFFSDHRANKPNVVDQVRKSSGDDIVEEKAVDEKKSYFEKFGYESRAIGFVAFEDIYQIAFSEDMNNNWNFTIMYMQIGNNSLKNYITSHNSHSITANVLAVRLGYKYYITDNISPYIALGTGYMMSSWEDTVQKTSGDKNIILYGGGVGVGVFPFQFEQLPNGFPFPMNVGFIIGVVGEYLPSSYAVDDGIVTLEDWKITLMPVVSLYIGFPK